MQMTDDSENSNADEVMDDGTTVKMDTQGEQKMNKEDKIGAEYEEEEKRACHEKIYADKSIVADEKEYGKLIKMSSD